MVKIAHLIPNHVKEALGVSQEVVDTMDKELLDQIEGALDYEETAEEPEASQKQSIYDYVKGELEGLTASAENDPSFFGVHLFSCGCDYADCYGNNLFFRDYGKGFEIELTSHFKSEPINFEQATILLRLKRMALENKIATIDQILNTKHDFAKE